MAKQDISVRKLVDKVSSGELSLPEMQRRYVWTSVKVRDLLDSLYREYPSGTILVWETDDPGNYRKLQVGDKQDSPLSSKLLLLDGQQRLTSLSAIINGEPIVVRNKKRPIDILFNLEHPDTLEEELTALEEDENGDDDEDLDDDDELDLQEQLRKRTFVVGNRILEKDPIWVSVTDIFKKPDSQILKSRGINSEDPRWDKYTERIGQVRKIQDYNYVMIILDKSMSYEEVTEIFVRVNSLGAKLRGSDLALAQLTSRWRGFMNELEAFAKEFDKNEDYFHETGLMVKSLVSLVSGQSKYKTVNRFSLDDYHAAWKDTKNSLRFAYNFLQSNARIDNLRLISSPYLMIPIAYYANLKNEKLKEDEVRQLLLWFYVAHMKGRYSRGSSESILDSDLTVIRNTGSLTSLLEHMKVQVKDFYVNDSELKFKNRRSPYFSLLFLIAKQKGVKDWFSGLAISEKTTGRAHAVQFHHIMPKSLLRDLGKDRRAINDIANLTFIGGKTNRSITNKLPKEYIKDLLQKRGESIFEANYIPSNPELWELDNFEKFMNYRRDKMVSEINGFIRNLEV
jgi:hypothetical protein